MSNWRDMLKEAKELLDEGFINEQDYEKMKQEALALRSQSTNPGTTTPPTSTSSNDTLMGSTSMGSTGFGNPGMDSIGGDPFVGDTLAGVTQFQAVGQTIGSYKVLGELGRGGMGAVYRARHSVEAFAKRTGGVVIKLMNPELSKNPDFVDRFIGEAALGRSIKHPNFVDIHDVIIEPNTQTLAIVMDLVEGRPLDKVIPEGGMSFEEALPIIEQLSDALDHIHKQGIIHRDLKPDNIIVQPDGTPIILDMGIAKDTTDSDMSKTSTGVAMGTPLYMAPEQLDAKNATSSVDRYAFGLIVYQMLSGRLPWEDGLGQGEILAYKFGGNLEPLKGQPKHVGDAVMGLLRASAGDRWDSCAEFMSAFVESEEDRRQREQAERAEQERLERLERERLEAIRLEQERKEQTEQEQLAELKRQKDARKRREQERIEAEKRRKREETERKAREEAERQRKTEEERIAREQQERLEAAQAFAKEYKSSMAEIESKRTSLKAKLEADIESARAPLTEAERALKDGIVEVEQKRKSLQVQLSTELTAAKRPWNKAESDLEETERLLKKRESMTSTLTEKERELESLDGFWSSLLKGGEIAKLKDEIADLQQELSNIPSVADLETQVQTLTTMISSVEKAFNAEKARLEEVYNKQMIQLNVDGLEETVETARVTFNTAKENLEKAHQTALNEHELREQESRLNVERESIEQEFSWFMLTTKHLDVVEFGSGNGRHEMVVIPKGAFMMGEEVDGDAWADEKPRHKVTLTRDFLMGKYSVTQALWESVMGANPSKYKGANRPVECVSWFDCVEFCNKLSEMEGLEPVYRIYGKSVTCNWNAKGYRLPTEAEWEYSARSGQHFFKYAGSNNVDEVAWYRDKGGKETHPVGQKKANSFGLYDMSGNVWEWVWDVKGDYSRGGQTDPTGPIGPNRVLRGGSWGSSARDTRASHRGNYDPSIRYGDLGFRLARLTPN